MVSNYEDAYLGSIDLETATIHSDNSVYAQLTAARRARATSPDGAAARDQERLNGYFAIGLGAEAVNPLEMARAFSTFANGGRRIDGSIFGNRPRAIVSVADGKREEKVVPTAGSRPRGEGELVNEILQKVVTSGNRDAAPRSPTGPSAGKTGTTENYGDAWFVGYTPQLAVAVWVGYPNELRPMLTEYHGDPVAGGTFPALIWKTFMEEALATCEGPEYLDSPSLPVRRSASASSSDGRAAHGRQRSLPRSANVWIFSDRGRSARRTASRTRSRCRGWSA